MTTHHLRADGIDLDRTVRVLGMLPRDPTLRLEPGSMARATHTPVGPGTISASWEVGGSTIGVRAHGPGADWLLERAPALFGIHDTGASGFEPGPGPFRELWRRHPGVRVLRTGTVWHDLCWTIVQQRIQRVEAAEQWRRFVQRYGSPAPDDSGLFLPPTPDRVGAIPSFEWHRIGIERRRADTLRAAARAMDRLERLVEPSPDDAARLVGGLVGVGPWTTSMLSAVTWGDPDAVIVGDSGIPGLVGWSLAGRRTAGDHEMIELLEPFRPHRYRVVQLALLGGRRPPRHAARRARTDIASR